MRAFLVVCGLFRLANKGKSQISNLQSALKNGKAAKEQPVVIIESGHNQVQVHIEKLSGEFAS